MFRTEKNGGVQKLYKRPIRVTERRCQKQIDIHQSRQSIYSLYTSLIFLIFIVYLAANSIRIFHMRSTQVEHFLKMEYL